MQGKFTAVKRLSAVNKEGFIYWAFFHMEDGKSARSCIVPSFSNFARWKRPIELYFAGKEVILENLHFVHGRKRLVDANSLFTLKQEA